MSLDRFINSEEIIENSIGASGNVIIPNKWTAELESAGLLGNLSIDIADTYDKAEVGIKRPVRIEGHLYGMDGSYVDSAYNLFNSISEVSPVTIDIKTADLVDKINVKSGKYISVINVHGTVQETGNIDDPGLYIAEISSDRRELYLRGVPGSSTYESFLQNVRMVTILNKELRKTLRNGNLIVNFGKNRVCTIINMTGWDHDDGLAVKLLKPLPEDLGEGEQGWFEAELADPAIINLSINASSEDTRVFIRRPNFDAVDEFNTITETDFQNYAQLLGKSTSTSEQIVQNMLSGSISDSPIGVDYSGFQNFVHYSSAAERLANFKYKLEQIEHYDTQIKLLSQNSSNIAALNTDKNVAVAKKTAVIGSFDGFEKWLYNEPTASLFTHQPVYDQEHNLGNPTRLEGGLLAADVYQIQPYPKYLSASYGGGEYVVHNVTSSIATEWYNGTLASASLYDTLNEKSLVNSIPEHIRLDSNNDQYELFVNMVGHHYDILYSYADALARTYHPIEHPKLGHTKDTLYNVAKSLGWKLYNGKQATQLWQYKLGRSETGSLASTGSIFTKSDEDITTEVWRRIVNNLPHLLKTKGTARGVKALMNTYGIPQTLLSIREYGGPKIQEDEATLIEDRFTYALNFNQNANLEFSRGVYSSSIANWGLSAASNKSLRFTPDAVTGSSADTDLTNWEERPPDTIEFRFKPGHKQSMYLLSNIPRVNTANMHWAMGIQYTASYSGSDQYGRLFFQFRDVGNGGEEFDEKLGNALTSYTNYVPLYDGDFWNVRLWTAYPFVTASHSTPTVPRIYFQTQKASDYIDDKIIHRTSGSLFMGSGSNTANAATIVKYWASKTENKKLILGGSTGNGLFGAAGIIASKFSGSMQEYREWMEILTQEAFDLHTLNPTSYVSGLSATSSYDTLVRHYPLGTNLNAVDHSREPNLFITSSHPNSTITDFSPPYPDGHNQYATASLFATPVNAQRGNYLPHEETYYVQGVSLGGNVPKSKKIRFDENKLITRLSPVATAEVSRFDNASLDSNRLGLFYSMADQINKEIFNHIGDVALDDYVGDPDDQYEYHYPDLSKFAKEYWKKYSDRNDINAYMRIFAQYDFALFQSIKQMLPDRTDEAMGLLVEPHALERVKVVPFKRPVQSPHHYDTLITGLAPTASGLYPYYEGAASGSPEMTGEAPYTPPAGDNGYSDVGNYFGEIIPRPKGVGTDYCTKHIFPVDERPSITGSVKNVYTVEPGYLLPYVDNHADHIDSNAHWKLNDLDGIIKILKSDNAEARPSSVISRGAYGHPLRVVYDTAIQHDTIQDLRIGIEHDTGVNPPISASLHMRFLITEDPTDDHVSIIESRVTSSIVKHITETQQQKVTLTGSDSKIEFTFKDVHIPRRTDITLELFYQNESTSTLKPEIDHVHLSRTINKTCFSYFDDFISEPRKSSIYKKKVLHYHQTNSTFSKRKNDELRVISESLHHSLFQYADDSYGSPSKYTYSSSLDETHYRDDENNKIESKHLGSQITAPGINVISGYAELNYEPIVEIFITNPNQVVYNTTPQVTELGQENPGNISVNAGPTVLVQRPFRPVRGSGRPNVSYI